jgi:hypothetical protein
LFDIVSKNILPQIVCSLIKPCYLLYMTIIVVIIIVGFG